LWNLARRREKIAPSATTVTSIRRRKFMRLAAITFLIFVMGATFACGAKNPAGWTTYNSPAGRYSVLFPGKPELSTDKVTARTGENFAEYFAICTDPDGGQNVVYDVAYFDLGPNMGFSFDESRDGLLKAANATLQSEKTIQLGAYAGRELKASANNPGADFNIQARIILAEKRVYIVEFVFPRKFESAQSAEKSANFFNSFALSNSH
jgi:hypothetical protein